MDESHTPVVDAREPGAATGRRSSLAGMFPFLQKQASMDTDPSDRARGRVHPGAGGKVRPGKQPFARSSSGGDSVLPPDSPCARRGSGGPVDSPSAAWVAAGQATPALNQSWPGPASPALPHATPTRGLFSKLLSKKRGARGSPPVGLHSPSLGASSGSSPSPHGSDATGAAQRSAAAATPPPRAACGGGGSGDRDDDGGSCYSTPVGSDTAAAVPGLVAQLDAYGGDTLDLGAVACGWQTPAVPLASAELPDVFTPGFSELLRQAGGNTGSSGGGAEPPTPADGVAGLEPTVALVTGAQLCNAVASREPAAAALLMGMVEQAEVGTATPMRKHGADTSADDAGGILAEGEPAAGAAPHLRHDGDNATAGAVAGAELAAAAAKPVAALPATDSSASVSEQAPNSGAGAAAAAIKPVPAAHGNEHMALGSQAADAPPTEHAAGELRHGIDGLTTADGCAAAAVVACSTAVTAEAQSAVEDSVDSPAACAKQVALQADGKQLAGDGDAGQVAEAAPAAGTDELVAPCGSTAQNALDPEQQQQQQQQQQQAVIGFQGLEKLAAVAAASTESVAAVHSLPDGITAAEHEQQQQQQHEQQQRQTEAENACAPASRDAELECPGSPPGEAEQHGPSQVVTESEGISIIPAAAEPCDDSGGHDATAACSPASKCCADDAGMDMGGDCLPAGEADAVASVPAAPGSPQLLPLLADPAASESPVQSAPECVDGATVPSGSARRAARPRGGVVRESMPLFLSDPCRAMGSPLSLEPGDDLDAQDMQQLADGSSWRARAGGVAVSGRARLLAHGGPQRIAAGGRPQPPGSSPGGWLEPVAEASYASSASPAPEESPPAGPVDGSGASPGSRALSAASPTAEGSPLRPRQLSVSPAAADKATSPPAPGSAHGPSLNAAPGSAHSTPTLALGRCSGPGPAQVTPPSVVSSAVGSAIRAAGGDPQPRSSPLPTPLPEASPTLLLLPAMAGAQGADTPTLPGGAGTPSLLDARAASPSAVYAMRVTATPFRGALAALPLDAALAAPLVDSSPFSLHDGCGLDTVCLADEAQRVAQNLAAAASSYADAHGPGEGEPLPGAAPLGGSPGSSGSAAALAAAPGSPTQELRDLHVVMLTKQLAELQKRNKELEGQCLRLREQVDIYEFEKTELNSQEEMEKAARQYAEEQLQALQLEVQQLLQARGAAAAQMVAMRGEFEALQAEAQAQHAALAAQHAALAASISALQAERNEALDRLNLVDMTVTALRSNNADLGAALEAEQARGAELEAAVAARDRELADAARSQLEAQAKLERAMEQVIAANTAKEHARQKAADEAAKAAALASERQALVGERDRRAAECAAATGKAAAKAAALRAAEAALAAKEQENQELMGMCDQLLAQQEARRQE